MASNIRVAVRIRPILPPEIHSGHKSTHIFSRPDRNELIVRNMTNETKFYKFDYVFDQTATQQKVFTDLHIPETIHKVVEGFHATIFAFGQTGSGKTFTMEGVPSYPTNDLQSSGEGISLRSINELFSQINGDSKSRYRVSCSFLQIYNEKIFDLLNPSTFDGPGLRLRWSREGQFQVENLFTYEVNSTEEALQVYKYGTKNRITTSHKLNNSSSRSHSIFCVSVEAIDNETFETFSIGKLQLVDLAGSERSRTTGSAEDTRHFKEAIDINKSLFTLGKVISVLAQAGNGDFPLPESVFVPYRDSKLTSLLKQSLGGNSFTIMIACIAPLDAYLEETLSTLQYASMATSIVNEPLVYENNAQRSFKHLKKRNRELEKELMDANKHIGYLTNLLEDYKSKNLSIKVPENILSNTNSDSKGDLLKMVKDLVRMNNKLRETVITLRKANYRHKYEIYRLNTELQEAKEKLEFIEDSNRSKKSASVIINRFMETQTYCNRLEAQLKYAEYEKLNMTKELGYVGNKEPTRPIFAKTPRPVHPKRTLRPSKTLRNSILNRSKTPVKPKSGILWETMVHDVK